MNPNTLSDALLRDMTGQSSDWRVINPRLINGRIKVLDLKSMTERYEELEGIRLKISAGKVRVERKHEISVAGHVNRKSADDGVLAKARDLLDMVKEEMKRARVSFNKAYDRLLADEDATTTDTKLSSRPTMYRWFKNDNEGVPLLKGSSEKGNHTARYSDAVRSLIVDQATELYLVPKSRWSILKLTEHVNDMAHDQHLIPADRHVSREFVKTVIFEDATTDSEKERLDPKVAISAKAIAKGKIRVNVPFQRVEQDALHLPFALRTPWGISTNVWLVHAIDCALSFPVGWHFVVGSPTDSDSLKCVDRIFSSKAAVFQSLGITTAPDLYGTPMRIIFDNGPETKGERMRALSRLNTTVTHCKARAAHGKPFIERLNLSLKVALEVLPGCTRFDGVDGARDPLAEGDEIMDWKELERWVVRWYFEDWINKPLERLKRTIFIDDLKGQTPALRLKHLDEDEEFAFPLPPNSQEWRLIQFEKKKCILSRKTGITFDTFQFAGPNLEHLIKVFGESEIPVLVDPDNFRQVSVPVGDDFTLVELVNKDVDEDTPAYSFEQAKQILKSGDAPAAPSPQREAFRRDLLKRAAGANVSGDVPKKSTRKMSKDTTQRAKGHAAVERAAGRPLQKVPPLPEQGQPDAGAVWSMDSIEVFTVVDLKSGSKLL